MVPGYLDLNNLRKLYGEQTALDGINLSIAKGSMNFLLGANGSGKSTLLKCLAGHDYWDSGEIFFNGNSRTSDRKDFNSGIHFISEDIVPPHASLGQLRVLYQNIYGQWDDSTFEKFLSWGNLQLSKNLSTVSRGQKVQGLLALSLASNPDMLLIDEATAVLDPFIRSRFIAEIDRRNKEIGMTTVIATNIGTEVAFLKGRLLIMQKGKLIVDRSADTLASEFVKIRVDFADVDKLANAGFSFIEQNRDNSISFLGKEKDLSALEVKYQTDKRAISIDEVFIFYSDREVI